MTNCQGEKKDGERQRKRQREEGCRNMTRLAREALLRRTMTKTKEGRTSHKRSHICGAKESQSDFHCTDTRTAGAGKDEKRLAREALLRRTMT